MSRYLVLEEGRAVHFASEEELRPLGMVRYRTGVGQFRTARDLNSIGNAP